MVKAGVYLVARFAPAYSTDPTWRVDRRRARLRHHAARRLPGAAAARPQAHPRVRHGQPAGPDHPAGRARARGRRRSPGWRCSARTRCSRRRCSSSSASSTPRPARVTCGGCRASAASCKLTALAGALATASMIGLPPFAGYVAKEAGLEALGHLDDTTAGMIVLVAVVGRLGADGRLRAAAVVGRVRDEARRGARGASSESTAPGTSIHEAAHDQAEPAADHAPVAAAGVAGDDPRGARPGRRAPAAAGRAPAGAVRGHLPRGRARAPGPVGRVHADVRPHARDPAVRRAAVRRPRPRRALADRRVPRARGGPRLPTVHAAARRRRRRRHRASPSAVRCRCTSA